MFQHFCMKIFSLFPSMRIFLVSTFSHCLWSILYTLSGSIYYASTTTSSPIVFSSPGWTNTASTAWALRCTVLASPHHFCIHCFRVKAPIIHSAHYSSPVHFPSLHPDWHWAEDAGDDNETFQKEAARMLTQKDLRLAFSLTDESAKLDR